MIPIEADDDAGDFIVVCMYSLFADADAVVLYSTTFDSECLRAAGLI